MSVSSSIAASTLASAPAFSAFDSAARRALDAVPFVESPLGDTGEVGARSLPTFAGGDWGAAAAVGDGSSGWSKPGGAGSAVASDAVAAESRSAPSA